MPDELSAALIITTYNWPKALALTLDSALNQSRKPDEIIVADDGSAAETADVVRKLLAPSGLPWSHVRHEDKGIRQARIKNLAVRSSCATYLIFIDHDVLLHPNFVSDHLRHAEKGCFLQGKRCFLAEHQTKRVLEDGLTVPMSPFIRGLENRKNAFRYPKVGRFLSRPKRFQKSLRGCNLSMHRENFLAVDGYDEVFDQLWGREDSDICYRLFHTGVKIRNLWFCALQYHLHHDVARRQGKDRLDRELRRNLGEKRKRAVQGYSQLSQEGAVVAGSDPESSG
jgi:glycosyltransferase involved in cell wall biosynthesis